MSIKGYKVFNPDWTCRGFQYEVGKTFVHTGNIEMCGAGFHFCRKASDCFNYYNFNSNNKVAEVEAVGLVETRRDKSVTNEIKIIREIPWIELLNIVNEGENNSGLKNTGNCNTGSYNTGSYNTGSWNRTNYSTGFLNSIESTIYIFDKPTTFTRKDILNTIGMRVLDWNFEDSWWIYSENMTDEEKKAHPEHETTGGYLKTVDFKTACKMMWDNLGDDDKQSVKDLPNFDEDVFLKITGIDIKENA